MTARYRVTFRAYKDLAAIARYKLVRYGRSQRDIHLRAIGRRFDLLAEQPDLGRRRGEIAERCRSFPEGEHVIFYIVGDNGIDIIGLPHRLMDLLHSVSDSDY